MGFFGNAKRRKELSAAVNTLREQEIRSLSGTGGQNGMLVFSVGHSVVTEAELLQLHRKEISGRHYHFSTKVCWSTLRVMILMLLTKRTILDGK